MSSTGSPERWTRPKTTSETPTATMAARPSRRRRNGSASGLHVGVAHPQDVVRAHLEALHLLADAEQLLELPEEEPHRLVVQRLRRLGDQLLAALGIDGALLLLPD